MIGFIQQSVAHTCAYWHQPIIAVIYLIANSIRLIRGLKALREDALFDREIVVTLEDNPRRLDGIELLPWSDFLELLWHREL